MISINLYEILMQMVNFMILLWLMKKFMYTPLIAFLDKRERSIEHDITKALTNKKESEKILDEQKEMLEKAHQEAKRIREKAEEISGKEHQLAIEKAKEDSEALILSTKKEIEMEYARTKKELQNELGNLAISLSERILEKNINKDNQSEIINDYLAESRA